MNHQDIHEKADDNHELLLILFVAGHSPRSMKARANLERILTESGHDMSVVEVVDVLTHPDIALDRNIFATPALIPAQGNYGPLYGDFTYQGALESYVTGILNGTISEH